MSTTHDYSTASWFWGGSADFASRIVCVSPNAFSLGISVNVQNPKSPAGLKVFPQLD